ncbi:alpha/beta fold hydrolase [Pseudonocardia eucalypti]|uniref:Alpha/beta fold hydrolase n=1 Tax=Pseudonocardia eucalypti TaxID=648755 RepID=A0ABP9RFJ5_9PSEU|nr:pimeloyl-ACP methyl ester carboxylesterase [Pseudonocardia eucalypti]
MQPPESKYVKADGVTFHYHELGTGPDTVFLHGGGPGCTGWSDFGPVAPLFARARRCLLVDLLQYGRSDKLRITGPMWDFHAAKTVALLDSLGLEAPDIVCNSWGGTIALNLAAKYPDRVRSLVITGSMPVFYGPLAPLPEGGRRGRNARDVYYGGEGPTLAKMRELITRLEWYDPAKLPEETVELRYRQSLDPGERELAAMSDSPRGDWQDLTDELPRIQAPTLFMWGMQDAFLTPDYPLMLARMVPNGNLHVMDHASHHLQEERPAEYHAVVSGFLDSVAGR